jgi:predicted Mrr-cat superfamily restriction endonuclease
MWMVRAGEEGRLFEEFEKNKIISIGWNRIGDLSKAKDHADVKRMVEEAYKDGKILAQVK